MTPDLLPPRLAAKVRVDETTGCWEWTACRNKQGYGWFRGSNGQSRGAHRWTYEALVGPIPAGMDLDHLCHTNDETCPGGGACQHRACVNPQHLEPVTRSENGKRRRVPTHCPAGHEYAGPNLYVPPSGQRVCRRCVADSQARSKARAEAGLPKRRYVRRQVAS